MATIRLEIDDWAKERLPPVCAKCGAPAPGTVRKRFSWSPSWVPILILAGLLPYVIVAMMLTKSRTLDVPLCPRHHRHWLWRTVAVLGSLGFLVLLFALLFTLASMRDPGQRGASEAMGLTCLASFVCGFGWLIFAALAQNTAIRAGEITDDDISLTNVSQDFANAVRVGRQAEDAGLEWVGEEPRQDGPNKLTL